MKSLNNITYNPRLTKDMSLEEYARWCCLVEAIHITDKKMIELGIDPEEADWTKPIAFEHYINERFHSMLHDIKCEEKILSAPTMASLNV